MPSSIFGIELDFNKFAQNLKGTGIEAQRQITSNFRDFTNTISLQPIHNTEPAEPAFALGHGTGLPIIGEVGVFMIEHMAHGKLDRADWIKKPDNVQIMEI